MDHRAEIIRELRRGMEEIKQAHIALLGGSPLWQQWAYLRMYEAGHEWSNH